VHTLAFFAEQTNVLAIDASAIVVFVTALILVWVLNTLLFKPVNRVLDERERRTRGYHSEARAILAECDHKLSRYEAAIRQARAENYTMLEQKRREALQRRTELIAVTKQKIGQQLTEARRQIAEQVAEAKSQLEGEAPLIARRISNSVLGRTVEEVTRLS
jgi:F-type H+-transporting ATPase subunit b